MATDPIQEERAAEMPDETKAAPIRWGLTWSGSTWHRAVRSQAHSGWIAACGQGGELRVLGSHDGPKGLTNCKRKACTEATR